MKTYFSFFVLLMISFLAWGCGGAGDDDSGSDDDAAADDDHIGVLDDDSNADDDVVDDDTTDDDTTDDDTDGVWYSDLVVLANNDLGMHCMNEDFSTFMILPPYNTVHAQVIKRTGGVPTFVTDGITVNYSIPGNTTSVNKTNFWDYEQDLFGVDLPPDTGLTGLGLEGTMTPTGNNDWSAVGIPLTPMMDDQTIDSFQLGQVQVLEGQDVVAQTRPVVPVSWEIRCDMCHPEGGGTLPTGQDILHKHDLKHGTTLETDPWPIFCGTCHQQPELGAEGDPMTTTLSGAMHTAHSGRMRDSGLDVYCYACHPGPDTRCFRDVMHHNGIDCFDCHGGMLSVGDPSRQPWAEEPNCGSCHTRKGFDFEEPGKLYRDSKGHYGVHCTACHGSPHAITPSTQDRDNVQSIGLQGVAGPISDCKVCHTDDVSDKPFEHKNLPPTGGQAEEDK